MKRCEQVAGLDAVKQLNRQFDLAVTAFDQDSIAVAQPKPLAVDGRHLQHFDAIEASCSECAASSCRH